MIEIPQNTDGRKYFDKEIDRAISEALRKLSKKNWAELYGTFVDYKDGYSTDVLSEVGKAFEEKGYYVSYHGKRFTTGIEISRYKR